MKKILVVDDELETIKLLNSRLEAVGFTVVTAKDGAEGLKKARAEKPHLILLDIMLPIFNGYEVCKMLKEGEGTKDIPIIMVTGRTKVGDMEDGIRAGADEYITKPYEWEQLMGKIKQLLDQDEPRKK